MLPNEAAPVSFAPRRREITCWHEAGHAVVGVILFGSITGARIYPDGTGRVWRGSTPSGHPTECEQAARTAFSDTEDMLRGCGPMPIQLVNQHLAMWRSCAIFALAGPEAERLAFGLTISPPSSDLLSAKTYTRRGSFSRAGANLLLDHCRAESRALLQMRWPAVEAIAVALDRENELDGEAVAKLIEQKEGPVLNDASNRPGGEAEAL